MDTNLKSRLISCSRGSVWVLGPAALTLAITSSSGTPRTSRASQLPPPPANVVLTATIRDFKGRDEGGHTDFEWQPSNGFGHYLGQVADTLDVDGLPKFNSTGYKLTSEWQDASGRNIMNPRPYITAKPGDVAGSMQSSPGGSIHNDTAFKQWYRDVAGVNMSTDIPLTFVYDNATNQYVFDYRTDPAFSTLGGFFPINNILYGNYSNTGKNYHMTCMLETAFVFTRGAGHTFTFRGDDDVWVYVDGKLVIDLGGVHGGVDQTIELDRLAWLNTGTTYTLRFFFAERHTTQSNFRIETTLKLIDMNQHRKPAIKGWEEIEPD